MISEDDKAEEENMDMQQQNVGDCLEDHVIDNENGNEPEVEPILVNLFETPTKAQLLEISK